MPRPNILITGTPGTGKTTLCELMSVLSFLFWCIPGSASTYQLNYVHVGTVIRENGFVAYNEEMQCNELDEDAV